MKKAFYNILGIALLVFTSLSFVTIDGVKKEIKTDKSSIVWKGYKVTGSHEGNVSIQSGYLTFEAAKLIGGEVVLDMSSITVSDLKGGMKGKLEKHLKSDDFFGVENYLTAKLVFKNVSLLSGNVYQITADLTIKDKTNPITFKLSIQGNKATSALKIDRTNFGIEYKSASLFENLKDKAIYDEFDLVTSLEF